MRVIVVRLRPRSALYKLILPSLLLAGILLVFLLRHPGVPAMSSDAYRYDRWLAPDGIVLHTLQTTPDRIRLKPIDMNVTKAPYTGINGGFFWEGSLLSIAVENDRPLKGSSGDYGSGWYNTGVNGHLKRGTLVWDEAAGQFSVQVALEADELAVTDRNRYWAQGGVSMNLLRDGISFAGMIAEEMPAYDEPRMRSGLVYDRDNKLYLIVTPTPCTAEQFRAAIVGKLGAHRVVDGIFLDGDGSSQLQSKQIKLPGDRRQVYQMITIS
ncbi:hypothetical protein [Paenibacillus ginsengarvi]|uniref:Phosphodiester glycosidase domain-containing protein n=1 Tax=Paenibacillus ginsengarvi TaxID=400777 RepID=A0A3B0C161_9BACL|nr:hypothetical protein [Paenibacillus ginsengarvi]RKN79112.1 hypothetical protein D7M11_20730 [Paenibacillus ginsengarvi]